MFRRKRSTPPPAGQGRELRAMALALDPAAIGLTPVDREVWGFVMDTGMADGGWHALVTLADGTTSLYTSAAFGVIGAAHTSPCAAPARRCFGPHRTTSSCSTQIPTMRRPGDGRVVMRALTGSGPWSVGATEDDLGHMRHPAAPVFHAAHAVITAIRQVTPGVSPIRPLSRAAFRRNHLWP